MGGKWRKNLSAEELLARERLWAMRTRWEGIRQRCENAYSRDYANYGGRGIKLGADWQNFAQFYLDMGEPPFEGAQVERVDNNGDYTKANCVWASPLQQSQNRRKHKKNQSGQTGVGFFGNRWEAYGMYKGIRQKLYTGPSKEEAIMARLEWERNKKG